MSVLLLLFAQMMHHESYRTLPQSAVAWDELCETLDVCDAAKPAAD